MTRLVGILGYPLAHSISPAFQQAAFDYHSIPARYHAWTTPPEQLESRVRALRGEDYLGANVTVPHKERVGEYLDDIDTWAERIGAVNTIVRVDDTLVGYNTDAYGFIKSLTETGHFRPAGRNVLLVGAGGAARAAVFALAQEGIASLTIANRTLERAESLAADIRNSLDCVSSNVKVVPLHGSQIREASANADLIVNSTSIGMRHSDDEGRIPSESLVIPPTALVYDMVYNPPETPLLTAAKAAGAPVLGGLPMLVYQGAAAFERWTGEEAPIDVMFRAAEEALATMTEG